MGNFNLIPDGQKHGLNLLFVDDEDLVMVTEEGIVIQVDATSAWVKTTKTADCEACAAKGSCEVMGGGKEMKVVAINEVGAKVDDHVVMSFKTASLLKASFLLYITPILALILGAVFGQAVAPKIHMDPTNGSVIMAFFLFAIMVMIIKIRANKMAQKREYRPQIIRIIPPAHPILEE